MTASLFIGGPWDGRLVEHRLGSATMQVKEHKPMLTSYGDVGPPQPIEPTLSGTYTYVRVVVLGFCYFVEQGVYERGLWGRFTPAEVVLDLLRQGYRRPSDIYGD